MTAPPKPPRRPLVMPVAVGLLLLLGAAGWWLTPPGPAPPCRRDRWSRACRRTADSWRYARGGGDALGRSRGATRREAAREPGRFSGVHVLRGRPVAGGRRRASAEGLGGAGGGRAGDAEAGWRQQVFRQPGLLPRR